MEKCTTAAMDVIGGKCDMCDETYFPTAVSASDAAISPGSNTCALTDGSFPRGGNCVTASRSVAGGQCTTCGSGHFPTALSRAEDATLLTNKCDLVDPDFPSGNCKTASTMIAGGQCTECLPTFYPTAASTESDTVGANVCATLLSMGCTTGS